LGTKYTCPVCQCEFTKRYLKQHIKTQHQGSEVNYQCSTCHKKYKSKVGLTKHTRSAHEGIKYKCNICQHTVTSKFYLKQHIMQIHFKERYPCKMCNYQATQKRDLNKHVKNVHQNSERITCSKCNKTFQMIYITAHMRTFHTGVQPQYDCKICAYKSIHRRAVVQHQKRVHQNNERITCSECNKTMLKDYEIIHMKTFHSGVQPQYDCKICTYKSIHKRAVVQHHKRVHQNRNT